MYNAQAVNLRLYLRTLVLTALCLLVLLAGRAYAQLTLWIDVDQAPMRIWRSGQAEVLLRLPRGTVVQPLYVQGVWTRVSAPGGQQGWIYQGHLAATRQPPALADIFNAAPESMILAEAAETARSSRSASPALPQGSAALRSVLDLRISPDDLDDFLSQGGIGEFANVPPRPLGKRAAFPTLHAAAPPGGEPERQVGLNLAARVVPHLAKADFGNALQRYVNMVGLAVARFAPGSAPRFRVVVLDLPEPVSFSLPGGIVMLSTGLIGALENEAQLACVLAHEMAHASLGHLWARAIQAQFFLDGGTVDQAGVRSPLFTAMLDDLLATALSQGLGRNLEFEADLAAIEMADRAGYDPQQWPRAIECIEQFGRSHRRQGPPEIWAALHPPAKERLARLRKLLVTLPGQDGLALGTERFRANR